LKAPQHPGHHGGLISERTAEIAMAAFLFAVGVVMMVSNYQLGAGWAKDGPESGYFPFRIGIIICLACLVVLAQTLYGRKGPGKAFVTRERFRPVLLVLLPTLLYVAGIEFLGIYVASALLIAGFMRAMDGYGWLKTIAISAGTNLLLFWLFEVQFLVPLPKGPLEAYFGY
jgi:putative tricarboxylic transport membrane protein